MGLAKSRSDVTSESDGSLVIAACYENYLHMYAMLAVFAERRGDDPTDALGPAPRELGGAI